jgi:glycosyltransferase involved in cell wall biosynthesis
VQAKSGQSNSDAGAGRRTVVIDARVLTGPVNGTQLHVLELIAGLVRAGRVELQALLPPQLSEYGKSGIEALPDVQPVTLSGAQGAGLRADIVHRPFQISTPADLAALAQLADRLVITQQDLINWHNPSYFGSREAWEAHRRLTRRALAVADRVVFPSAHARDDAVAQELVEPTRTSIIRLGVDHRLAPEQPEPDPPPAADPLRDGREAILCIGTDYAHKNRVFALGLAAELQRRHGWDGVMALAGPHVRHGSSAPEERRLLASDARLREAVIDLGEVSEAQKAWLLDRATLVLYPTRHEGFGLVPFEALDHGVPCLWAPETALSEILPDDAAGIVRWDTAASADRALELMREESARAENLGALARAAQKLRWDATAAALIDVYLATREAAPSPAGVYERREGLMQPGFSEDAVRLVGPGGLLPRDAERPLLALASHPRLSRPVFGALRLAYRASARWRRHRR